MMTKSATQALPQEQGEDPLSILLDGELPEEQARLALGRLGGSADMQARFRDYCAVGDALRGLHGGPTAPGLTARVMARLEQEPTILAPMRRARGRRTTLWLAAAAITAITWGLWSNLPDHGPALPLAANEAPPVDVQPYLAAHQDFAQAVIAPAEMNFTQVSLAEARP